MGARGLVHADVHGECVYVVGGCKLLAKGCSWLAVVHGYEVSFIPTECFIRKKLTFRLLFCSLNQSIHRCTKHCCVCSDEDYRIVVETSAFF